MLEFVTAHLGLIVTVVCVLLVAALHKFVLRLFGMIVIPEDSIGIVTKKFVLFGANKSLPDGAVVALNAEAGAKMQVVQAKANAESKTVQAEAEARVIELTGTAEGKKITAVGEAEAEVIRKKAEAVDQTNYATIEVAKALANGKHPLVPGIVAGGGNGGGGDSNSLVNVLLATLINGRVQAPATEEGASTNGKTKAPKA